MVKYLGISFGALGFALIAAPARAAPEDWLKVLDSPQLTTFILITGLFISLSVWAILERQVISRRFRKIINAKAIEDELLDFAPAGYLILRPGGFCYCSDRLREWLGLTSNISHFDELKGSRGTPGFDSESFERLKGYVLQIAKRRIPLPLRLSHTLQDEDLYVFGKNLRSANRNDSAILLWVTLGEGASPRIKPRPGKDGDVLQDAEGFDIYLEAQSETLNGLSTSVAIFGPDQALRFCNQAFRELWSLPKNWEDVVPNHGEFLDKMREERRLPEQADFASWRKHILSYYKTLGDPVEEMWHLPDGRTLRVITQPYLLGGLIVFFEDVTDKLDLERSYNTLIAVQRETLDHLHEAVTVIGSDGRIRLFNPNFVRAWSLSEAELKARPHVSDVLDMCRPLLDTGETDWKELKNEILGYIINRDQRTGSWKLTTGRVLQFNMVPLPDGASLLTLSDVSDTFGIETAIRDKDRALESADRLKSEFVASISEDLRLPLNSIIGFSEILDKEYFGELNDKQKNYLSWIIKASNQVRNFVDDVMDLATIEAGEVELKTDVIDFGATVKQVVDEVREKPHQKHFSISTRFGTTTGEVEGDVKWVAKAIANVLEDAIERVPPGGKISVSTKGGNDLAEINVSYINAEIPLFLREQHGDENKDQSPKEKDVIGLRLSLAGSIFRLHGGDVEYDLKPGKTSTINSTISRTFSQKFSGEKVH